MQLIGRQLEILFTALFLLMMQGVFWPPLSYLSKVQGALDASDPLSAAAHAGLILFLVVVSLARPRQMLEGVRIAWPIIILLGLAYLSAFWSDAPELVLRRATTLAATTLFAIYLACRFDLGRLVSLLVKLNACAVVASIVVVAVAPRLGLSGSEDYPNAWRGVFTAKNALGSMSAFGAMIALYALWRGYGPRLIAAALIPANLLLLYMAQSATPIVLLFAASYVAVVASAFRRGNGAGFLVGFALVVIGILGIGLLAVGWTEILALLNRSPTLTGRSDIWDAAITYISQRPWLGYGYGAFWRSDAVEARTIWGSLRWIVPHSHNAWLEVGLALGIVGLAGAVLVWLAALYRAVRVLTLPRATHFVFCVAIIVAILVVNLTEYEFLRADNYLWVFFTLAFVHLGHEAAAHRAAREAAAPLLPRRPIGAIAYPAPRTAL